MLLLRSDMVAQIRRGCSDQTRLLRSDVVAQIRRGCSDQTWLLRSDMAAWDSSLPMPTGPMEEQQKIKGSKYVSIWAAVADGCSAASLMRAGQGTVGQARPQDPNVSEPGRTARDSTRPARDSMGSNCYSSRRMAQTAKVTWPAVCPRWMEPGENLGQENFRKWGERLVPLERAIIHTPNHSPSIHLFIYPFIHSPSFTYASIHKSIHPSIHPLTQPSLTIHSSTYPSIHLFIHHLFIHSLMHPSTNLSKHLNIHPPNHSPSIHLFIRAFIHPSIHHPFTYTSIHKSI